MNMIGHVKVLVEALTDEVDLLDLTIEDARARRIRAQDALDHANKLLTYLQSAEAGEIVPAAPSKAVEEIGTKQIGAVTMVDEASEVTAEQYEAAVKANGAAQEASQAAADASAEAATQPEPQPDPEPEHPGALEQLPKRGPWNDTFLAACREEQLAGATLKSLAEKYDIAYPEFTAELKKWRLRNEDSNGKRRPEPPAPPKPTHDVTHYERPCNLQDPDKDRAASGWTVDEDIDLLTLLGLGWKAGMVADKIERTADEVKERYGLLVPSKSPEQQGVVIGALRQMKGASA